MSLLLALKSKVVAATKQRVFFGLPLLNPARLFSNPVDPVLALIAPDMVCVDQVISKRLFSKAPLVGRISEHIISAGGKRVRPALLLLVSGALGYTHAQKHQLAAVVEFIHTATLLHDDVVDESTLRRGRPTANEFFGNAASVLVGDFLYSRAFEMMVESNSMRVMSILAEATNIIAEGEVLQLMNMHNASLDEASYLRVIQSKTAKLFEASARLGAVLANSNIAIEMACANYGQALGTAFQLIDDALDYAGDAVRMGKNLGDDLREGKVTLPLIVALQRAEPADAKLIRQAIERSDENDTSASTLRLHAEKLQAVLDIIHRTDALKATRDAARSESERAIASIEVLPNSPYKEALISLGQQAIERSS